MQPKAEDFTIQAWDAIVASQNIAKEQKHQQIETEHVLLALIDQNAFAIEIIEHCGASINNLRKEIEDFIYQQPKLQSSPDSIYLGKSINQMFDEANKIRISFGDGFIAIEHILIALLQERILIFI